MPLQPLEVIWIPDETIRPPGPKMVVCIHPDKGWFYRINTRDHWRPCIKLVKTPDHEFLDHDSYLQCGDVLDLDEYVVDEALRTSGVIGTLSDALCQQLIDALEKAVYLSDQDKEDIRSVLQPLIRKS